MAREELVNLMNEEIEWLQDELERMFSQLNLLFLNRNVMGEERYSEQWDKTFGMIEFYQNELNMKQEIKGILLKSS